MELDIVRLVEKAVEKAVAEGADQAEAYAQRVRSIGVEIEKNSIRSASAHYSYGISVRAYRRGGMGFSYAERLDEEAALNIAKKASSFAKQAQPDPDFVTLPSPRKAPEVAYLYDLDVEALEVEQAIEMAERIIESAKVMPEVVINGGLGASSGYSVLANSLGVLVESRSTGVGCGAFGIIKKGEDVGSYSEWDDGRFLKDINLEKVGEEAAKGAVKYLGARKVETATLPIVFGVNSASSIVSSILWAANAESVQRNRSYLIGKLNEKVASDLITTIDDGTIPRGLASSTYDGEGVPKRRLKVIEEGVLKTYLHNTYTANKAKVETTASATRGLGGFGIAPSNIQIKLGEWTVEEMIKDMREGIYFELGGVFANPITGDISKPIDFGFKIEKGEIAYPIKATMIGANILNLAKNIDAVSKEYREEPGFIMPAFRVKEARVAGAK